MIKLDDFVSTYDFPPGQEVTLTDCGKTVEIFRSREEYDCFGYRYHGRGIERQSYDRDLNRVIVSLRPELPSAKGTW